jgi:hypothetical protein
MGGGGKGKKWGGAQHPQHQTQASGSKATKKAADLEFESLLKEVQRTSVQTMKLGKAQCELTAAAAGRVIFH